MVMPGRVRAEKMAGRPSRQWDRPARSRPCRSLAMATDRLTRRWRDRLVGGTDGARRPSGAAGPGGVGGLGGAGGVGGPGNAAGPGGGGPDEDRGPGDASGAQGRADVGSATVEIAVALPALVLVTVAALWGVTTASAQIACVDAVRAGARAAARGEPLPAVRTVIERAAPPGARVEVRRGRETTAVAVRVALRPPALTGFPALTLRARALAATEPGVVVP
jgi:hypothetical protein